MQLLAHLRNSKRGLMDYKERVCSRMSAKLKGCTSLDVRLLHHVSDFFGNILETSPQKPGK